MIIIKNKNELLINTSASDMAAVLAPEKKNNYLLHENKLAQSCFIVREEQSRQKKRFSSSTELAGC